jgi:hypothetical protein
MGGCLRSALTIKGATRVLFHKDTTNMSKSQNFLKIKNPELHFCRPGFVYITLQELSTTYMSELQGIISYQQISCCLLKTI